MGRPPSGSTSVVSSTPRSVLLSTTVASATSTPSATRTSWPGSTASPHSHVPDVRSLLPEVLLVWQEGARQRVGEPAGVLRLRPPQVVAQHPCHVGAGEGPDDLAGPPRAHAEVTVRRDPLRVRLHVAQAE